jgi:general secretion pathway protein B
MSYILDALRRADSERERGAVPGIHAQPVPQHWRDAARARRTRPWLGAVIGLSVVVLGAFAWHMLGREAPQDVAPSAAPATPSPVSAAPSPTPSPPAPATVAPAPPPVAQPAPSQAAPAAVAVAPTPPAAKRAEKRAERPRAAVSPSAEPARRKTSSPATEPATVTGPTTALRATGSQPAAAPTSPDARIPAQSELPPEIRSQLPTLAIGGSMYSENPSSRMLIVNGQLVHEGDTLAPGLSLEQIKLRSAVLRFKGHRYEISY